jgi:hypothetical protein
VIRVNDSKRRGKRNPLSSFATLRLREIERTIPTRTVEQTQAVLPEVVVTYREIIRRRWMGHVCDGELEERLDMWLGKMRHRRTFTDEQIAEAFEEAERRKGMAPADRLAEILGLEFADRQRLAIRTIGAVDKTRLERQLIRKERKREQDRIKVAIKRRKRGAISREEYLAESLSRSRPWERDGISKATWYRRRRQITPIETETGWSTSLLKSLPIDTPVSRQGNTKPVSPSISRAVIDLAVELGVVDQRGSSGRKNRAA